MALQLIRPAAEVKYGNKRKSVSLIRVPRFGCRIVENNAVNNAAADAHTAIFWALMAHLLLLEV
jgi:hypothetical protein